ncbi:MULTISPECIES: sigma-70 family RNA polymerase sigma factor [Streptomyces]|uniref:sigma-70 family RNA polymerase sigma factor n=1 Tax=Streptomyces TaxID=1883 RepID=UPI000D520CC0|nr:MULTISPECIES: sigma-70 family RNA polymerase sigma factor [Streptomyces]PVC78230.1 hypothetical protein DBP15_05275 [Streptomyces sp. CS065A]
MKRLPNDRYGGPEVMRLAEFEPPWPGPDEVLVGVGAAAANSLGWKMRNRQMKLMTGRSFPRAMGHDSAGVVAAVGTGVTRLKAGDAVPGRARFRQAGTFAGMVTAPEKTVVLRPVDLSCAQAAALDERERTITSLRFGQGMTRSEIGNHLGISQMQVSRILNRTLTGLRTSMLTES